MIKKFLKRIVKWLVITKLLGFPRVIIGKTVSYFLSYINETILIYYDPKRAKVLNLVRQIKNENEMVLANYEAYQIFMAVRRTDKIAGDIAEVGVYKGGSAKLICEAKGKKTLHLFDTFEGLPDLCELDDKKQFHKGQYYARLKDVKNYLRKYSNVHFYKGLFPFTGERVKNKKFSFVNLDLDIYESTLNSIKFFYSKMNKGGIIISHDYINSPGVQKAFDVFFKDKPEPIIELYGSQCLIVKL